MVKKGFPVPAARIRTRPFSRMPDGAAADERFAYAVDADGGLNARGLAHLLHGFLECDGVDDGGEHAHVVGGGAGDVTVLGERGAANEVAAAHDDRQLDAELGDFDALSGDVFQFRRFQTEGAFVAESLATDFQKDAGIGGASGGGVGHERDYTDLGAAGKRDAERKFETRNSNQIRREKLETRAVWSFGFRI